MNLSTKRSTVPAHAAPADFRVLTPYLREIDTLSLLSAEGEVAIATRILDARVHYWTALLSHIPFTPAMLGVVQRELQARKKKVTRAWLTRLDAAALAVRTHPTVATKTSFEQALAKLAHGLADIDTQSDIADMLFADIDGMSRGASPGLLIDVRLPRNGAAGFTSYLRGVRKARMSLHAARAELARANLRLVIAMAQRYLKSGRMSLPDLIQEGNIGLMTAVDRFDPRRGYRFSTYAAWWIRHAISRALSDRGRVVRLPVHVIEFQAQLAKVRKAFVHEHQREPNLAELAEAAGVPLERIERFGYALFEQATPRVRHDDNDTGAALGMEAMPADAPELETAFDSLAIDSALHEALEQLRPMEADVLRMRFGFTGQDAMSLREIGTVYSLSRERIRQIQERALTKLRAELAERGVQNMGEDYADPSPVLLT